MAICPGKTQGGNCGYMLYRCKGCGNVGCQNQKCSNCGFDSFQRCKKCGESKKEEYRH